MTETPSNTFEKEVEARFNELQRSLEALADKDGKIPFTGWVVDQIARLQIGVEQIIKVFSEARDAVIELAKNQN